MSFPTLYSKNKDGTSKEWSVEVKNCGNYSEVVIKYGIKDSKLKMLITKISKENKGGKKKFKSHFDLAQDEAKLRFNRKIKEGYSNPLSAAESEKKILNNKDENKNNDIPETKDVKGTKDNNDTKISQDNKDTKNNKDNKDTKDSKSTNDIKGIKDFNHTTDKDYKNISEDKMDVDDDETTNISRSSKILRPNKTNKKKHDILYPMLANDYHKKGSSIKFPCYVQPKIDGVRAIYYNDTLYSRNGNPFPNLDHIKLELNTTDLILDGELFSDTVKFEELIGLVKRQSQSDAQAIEALNIKFYVFDYISDDDKETNSRRIEKLKKLFNENKFKHVCLLITEECKSKEHVKAIYHKYAKMNYEGVILRNKKGVYAQNKRSSDLQKYKMFLDDEYKIIGYSSGSGKEEGCVVWECTTKSGGTFTVRPEGNYTDRKNALKNAKKYIGKMITVRYQNLTKDGIPRFPIGVSIRDYE